MTIILTVIGVIFGMSILAVLLFAHSACTHALEPELLVFDEQQDEVEEAPERHAAGELA